MSKLNFRIDQIAVAPANSRVARELIDIICPDNKGWVEDEVTATGQVRCSGWQSSMDVERQNVARLQFNYDLFGGEFEILDYIAGDNWIDNVPRRTRDSVCHLGMHCTEEELEQWRAQFAAFRILPVQEVNTIAHTNEAIKDIRRYHYVIFDTKHLLGVDLKFIVRRDIDESGNR